MFDIIKPRIEVIKQSKSYLLICFLFFLCGILLSCFVGDKPHGILFYQNVIDGYSIILTTKANVAQFLISRFFSSICIISIIAISGIVVYTLPFHFIIFLYQGFIFGAIFPYFYQAFAVSGVLAFILLVVPSTLINAIACFILSALLLNNCLTLKKYKKLKYKQILCDFLIAFMFCIIAIVIKFIMLCFVIRPLNIFF